MRSHLFLTGATGFVGRNILTQLIRSDLDIKISCLIRANSQQDAKNRLKALLNSGQSKLDHIKKNVQLEVLLGDITLPGLGMSSTSYNKLAKSVTHIIHAAANVSFQMPLEEARRINVGGTRNVLKLAEDATQNGHFQRLAYLSTAYVCGNRNGRMYEDELMCGQNFENTYQQSKCEAEQLLNSHKNKLPITIFRLSIIVGHSKTGCTTVFNVIYYPLKMLSRGLLKFVPGSPHTLLDVVPVDYVCRAICYITLESGKGFGQTFHLTSGPNGACTTRELARMAVNFLNKMRPETPIKLPRFISPRFFYLARFFSFSRNRQFLNKFEQYLPFLSGEKKFDQTNTREALSDTSIALPHFSEYFERLMQFCLDVNWSVPEPLTG
jgi:long-chain acyl-CoA synthetase